MALSNKKKYGLIVAGIGILMSVIALIAGTINNMWIVSSSILVIIGIILWFMSN